jgi:hypothetical protein
MPARLRTWILLGSMLPPESDRLGRTSRKPSPSSSHALVVGNNTVTLGGSVSGDGGGSTGSLPQPAATTAIHPTRRSELYTALLLNFAPAARLLAPERVLKAA